MLLGETAFKAIDDSRNSFQSVCQSIWSNPEGAFREYKTCELLSEELLKLGFKVERCAGGVPTAIKASFGSGKPVIGFLAEYDALPGLSQDKVNYKKPAENEEYGHGCGHNLMATACLAAVAGLKAEMEKEHIPGTIVFFGCPAEEVLTGKVFMARGKAFDGIDCAISFHPNKMNRVTTGSGLALNSAKFHFKGKTAHAGGDPHNGRSALDAVELMNVGANYLREHVPADVRLHYIITDGGTAPNIVPDKASVWYYVRSPQRDKVEEVYKRLVKVAEGAAHMTETKVEIEFLGGCYNKLSNTVLAGLIHKCMEEIPREPWTEEEIELARELNSFCKEQKDSTINIYGLDKKDELHKGLLPILTENSNGSTDVADVTWIAPGISFGTACQPLGVPGHSWQITRASGSSIGFKGAIYAAKALALWALKLMTEKEILEKAKNEFKEQTRGRAYVCPMPDDIKIP